MRAMLSLAILAVVISPASGDSAPPDRLDAAKLTVRAFEPLTNEQAHIDVSASAGIAGGLAVAGAAAFPQGIAHLAPAPDLPMGPFTNVGYTAEGTPCPGWWTAYGVVDGDAPPNDFAAVTQGQVKWLVHAAALSLAETEPELTWGDAPPLPCGADIVALLGSFSPSNNALPVTRGQLKVAVRPFWEWREWYWWVNELSGLGCLDPWTFDYPEDFALVNVGQVKNAFSFELPPPWMPFPDSDADGVPDGYEKFLYGTDMCRWDTDGDGISDGEEIARGLNPRARDTDGDGYADGTDPDPLAVTPWTDADGDGFPDAWRDFWFGTNAAVSASDDANTNGISNLASLLMGVNPVVSPTPGFASECGDASEWLVAWEIAPSAFSIARPPGLTNLVTRTLRVDRASPWQQLFVSARAIGAEGWGASDVSIRYGVDGGPVTNWVPAAAADSWRIPLGSGPVTNLTFVIEATGAAPSLSRPLHVIRWSPQVELAEDEAGRFLPMDDGKAPLFLARRRAESGWYVVPFTTSLEWLPHLGEIDAEMDAELALPPVPGLSITNGSERAFLARDPVWAELPPEGEAPVVRVCCWELEQETPGAIGSGPRASQFDSPYPLTSPALRKAFHRAREISADPSSPVTVRILPRHPLVGLRVGGASARLLRSLNSSTNDAPGEVDVYPPDTVTPEFDGVPDPDDAYSVDVVDSPDEGVEKTPCEDDGVGCHEPDPEKGDCDCAGGEDGSSLSSFRLRISLGSPTPGEVAGFVWTSLDEPTVVTPAVFHVLGTDAVTATTNALGEFTVICSAPAGRIVQVTNIVHGVALTVWNASGRLENRWEVTNPDGDAQYVRCRKLTISGNAVSDETFALDDWMLLCSECGPDGSRVADMFPDEVVTRTDELRGVTTVKRKWRMDPVEPDFVTDVHDESWMNGTCASSVMSEFEKVGVGSQARRRLARRYGYDEKVSFSETMDYWNDPANPYRHARLKSVRSDRRPWSYHDYDALGRETVRIEQLDGSLFPEGLVEVSHLVELPQFCSAKAVVTSYEPGAGDSRNRNDAFLPRRMDTWVMRAGKPPVLVGTETWRYTRTVDAQGVALRSCVHASGVGETLRTETTVEYPEDDYSVPKCLRGRMVSRTGFDGVTISCQVETGNWNESSHAFSPGPDGAFLRTTTRRVRNGAEAKTFTAEVEDVLRRLAVYAATCHTESGDALDWSASTYDDIDRLRSTMYSDGTSETNAYSCCRLLWRRDRQGRKVLRSAQTGTDDLYYAEEDVWLADVSTNGHFRVTQHFFDALGRETNTVTYAGTTPGEAAVPIGEAAILPLQNAGEAQLVATVTTTYPADAWGVSYWGPYSIRTDERGRETFVWESQEEGYTQTDEKTYTNGVFLSEVITTANRNGTTTAERYWIKSDGSDAWTRVTHSTDWLPDCRRVVIATTTASDRYVPSFGYVVVTNSISTYDLFGRIESTVVPGANGSWLVTSNAYDGVSDRILTTTKTGSLPVNYFYDELGERIGMARGNKSVWNRTTYETISQQVYRVVTTVRMTGSTTNAVRIQKNQLTGLSDSCRRHTITLTGNAAILAATGTTGILPVENGSVTDSLTAYDPSTGIETTTTRTDGQTPVVTRSLHGIPLEQTSFDERRTMAYDAFGQNVFNVLENARTGATNRTEYIEYDISGNAVRRTADYGADGVAVSTAEFDMLNREVRRTDALGHVTETAYDGLGRPVFTGGDTYPLKVGYDTQGRKTSSATTRDNGATWDETQWEFDPVSGVNTAKVYADGSRISYDYTDYGQRTRTTWARGAWKQHAYNDRNLVSGTTYSGTATPSVAYSYDDSDKMASATLSDGTSYAYAYDDSLLCTNEAVTIAEDDFTITRTYDTFQRNEETTIVITNVRHAAKTRLYDSENRVCGYALTNSLGRGVNVTIAYDGSYLTNIVYALPNGNQFTVNLTRKASRKELVTLRDYSYGAQPVYWYSTDYDLIGRPTNATDSVSLMREWLYNNRSELAAASIGTNLYGYSYDTIGNRLWSAANLATNTYAANSLNQYTTVGNAVPSAPLTSLLYDVDGNMTRDGAYSYSYDAENRLRTVTSRSMTNGALRVLNAYDHRNHRIRKIVQQLHSTSVPPPAPPTGTDEWLTLETHTFVWDGNNIILEKDEFADGTTRTFEYFWGADKSGTEQGAGGVGGLLAVSMDGVFYIPCYDHNGNVVLYVSETGSIAAQYTYDPYGNVIESSGPLADVFSFGFSTQYHDRETGMVGYQQRVYQPVFGRWLNRDPIEEEGGENLYCFVMNVPSWYFDFGGMHTFEYTDLGWSYADVYSGKLRTKRGDKIESALGATPYFLTTNFICKCSQGKYVPDYTFKLEVYTLIQNADDKIWENDNIVKDINDPRVKNKWKSFWFFKTWRRRNLVIEHEERHRKHAIKNYNTAITCLSRKEQYATRSQCEVMATANLKAVVFIFGMSDEEDYEKVERGDL